MNLKRFYLLYLFRISSVLMIFMMSNSLTAQEEGYWHPVYNHYSTNDGLPSMELYYSIQDAEGYMWFASDNGVSRFNGVEFENFSTKDGLISNTVFKIVPDDRGRIWFLSDKLRLCYFEKGEIKPYKYNSVLENALPIDIVKGYSSWSFSDEGIMICINFQKAIKIDNDGVLSYPLDSHPELKESELNFLEVDNQFLQGSYPEEFVDNERIVYLKVNGIHKRIHSKYTTTTEKMGVIDDERIYLANIMDIGICSKSGVVWHHFENKIFCTSFYDGKLWIGLEGEGIRKFSIHGTELKEELQLFKEKSITNVFKDDDNQMWFTSLNHGIFNVKDLNVSKLYGVKKLGISILEIEKAEGLLLIRTEENELLTLDEKTLDLNKINKTNFIAIEDALVSTENGDEIFINGTLDYGGTNALATVDQFENGSLNQVYTERAFISALKLNSNTFIYGTRTSIIISGDKTTEWEFPRNSRISELKDENHAWVTSFSDLKKVNFETGELSDPDFEILRQRVNDVHKIGEYTLFGTNGNGVLISKNGVVETLKVENGGLRSNIKRIVSLGTEMVWILGSNGATKLLKVGDGKFIKEDYEAKLLMCEKLNGIQSSGEFTYIATNNGLIRIKNKVEVDITPLPKVIFKGIDIDGIIYSNRNIELSYDENTFTIQFDGVSFQDKSIIYRYRTSAEKAWVLVNDGLIPFNSMTPEEYKIELQASIDGENWTESQRCMIRILPPFWLTWWFVLFEFLLGLGITIWLILIRLKIVNRRHAQNQKMMELQQEALTQQMNPHFIFNALGSVQNSILKGNSVQANKYLVKFSKLLRSGLNASRSQLIHLEDDKELMENYLSVEKTRLGDEFTFSIEIKSDSKPYSLYIPPFLLQPFLENSIKHGIGEDYEAGNISVLYEEKKEFIRCTIEDNGRGREASNYNKLPGHLSHGNNIAFERIELFNRSKGYSSNEKIEDLYDDDGNPMGTKVIFTLPIIRE